MAGYSSASWAKWCARNGCITKDTPPPFDLSSTTSGYTPLGYGGTEYVATLLGCDPKTIRQGQRDLDQLPDGLGDRVRQKGADESPV
jgi:hypothetical protein